MTANNENPHLTTRGALVEERLRTSMAHSSFYHRIANKIKGRHLAAYFIGQSCCQPFFYNDLNNSFFTEVDNPTDANLLVIFGPISPKLSPLLTEAYLHLSTPKMAITIGRCTVIHGDDGQTLPWPIPIDFTLDVCPREKQTASIFGTIRELWLQKVAGLHHPTAERQE